MSSSSLQEENVDTPSVSSSTVESEERENKACEASGSIEEELNVDGASSSVEIRDGREESVPIATGDNLNARLAGTSRDLEQRDKTGQKQSTGTEMTANEAQLEDRNVIEKRVKNKDQLKNRLLTMEKRKTGLNEELKVLEELEGGVLRVNTANSFAAELTDLLRDFFQEQRAKKEKEYSNYLAEDQQNNDCAEEIEKKDKEVSSGEPGELVEESQDDELEEKEEEQEMPQVEVIEESQDKSPKPKQCCTTV